MVTKKASCNAFLRTWAYASGPIAGKRGYELQNKKNKTYNPPADLGSQRGLFWGGTEWACWHQT